MTALKLFIIKLLSPVAYAENFHGGGFIQ